MSSIDHLHQETAMLPVRDHNVLLTDQFYAACAAPAHPNHHLREEPPRPRQMKHTIHSFSRERTQEAETRAGPDASVKFVQKQLHTSAVQSSAPFLADNVVLGGRPPPISRTERILPRNARTKLAQLRSNYCRNLRSYVARIDAEVVDACPHCNGTPHDTVHLFNCPIRPTILKPVDLWSNPLDIANQILPLL